MAKVAFSRSIDKSEIKKLKQRWKRPNEASAIDPKMEDLRQMILSGFPNDKGNLTAAIRPFWHVCEQFFIDQKDGMIVVIPKAVRRDMLLHCLKIATVLFTNEFEITALI
ncbi:hypothetical protein T03_10387 [Trichinella britovi]|uniref:Uncharacterized protein n=1 Tax=Trichinella britovi TaxID=45882 RepID=A0A0V1D3Y4_TRIBR|nr:hypothetical protein T03_10387 [Trichinella britovi]